MLAEIYRSPSVVEVIDPGGVGGGYGGDCARRGVLGDGFARSRPLGVAAG